MRGPNFYSSFSSKNLNNKTLYAEAKVMVQCPQGHEMYPNGVKIKTLWNNHGIRLGRNQQVDVNCYKYTPEQYAWIGVECKECSQNAKINSE